MAYSKIRTITLASVAVLCLGTLGASGQVLRGNVVNGTTKKPVAGETVVLIKPDQGMTEEARTKTNARGEFRFELPNSQSMRAVRVTHDKVSFFQRVLPGSTSVSVTVYESAPEVPGVRQVSRSVILQAQGNALEVIELFDVVNESQPPRTQPTLSFYLPDGATVESGTAQREGGMPLKSAPVPQEEKGKYFFMYPLNPGQTHFELVYQLPYAGSFNFQPKLASTVDKFYVVTPKSLAFAPESPSQYQSTDQWVDPTIKGIDVHIVANAQQTSALAFKVSGEGVLPRDQPNQQQSASGAGAEEERPGGGMGIPNERPNPLSQGQYAFLGVLTLFLAGGAALVFVTSRPGAPAAAASPQHHPAPLLDALKEEMFELETDRIQGKLNQQEYEGAKSVLDKALQRAMKKKQ
jgi:hypothetical protein